MIQLKDCIKLLLVALIVSLTAELAAANSTSDCDVIVILPDTTTPENTEITIPIYFDNFLDTLLGFALWIKSDRPASIFAFQLDSGYVYDTLYWQCLEYSGPDCIDSLNVPGDSSWDFITVDSLYTEIGLCDTTGTLTSGWEFIESRSISGNGTDFLIVGIANMSGPPFVPGSPPQQGGTLIKAKANVFQDTDLFTDSIVNLNIETTFIDNFGLVFPNPDWTPWTIITQPDTNCYICTQWTVDTTQNPPDSVCLNWQQSALPPCDSIGITVDTLYILDSNKVCIHNGSIRITPPYVCGDLNGDGVGGNILDLNFYVNCIFRGDCQNWNIIQTDVNCDLLQNLLDLNEMVNHIFRGGPAPCTGPGCL